MFKPIKTVPLEETVILRVDFPGDNPLIVLGEVLNVRGATYHCYFGTYNDAVKCIAPDDWNTRFTHWAPVKKKRKEV